MNLTAEQFKDLSDGVIVRIILTGQDWNEDEGTVERCVKVKDRLYPIKPGFYDINEMNSKDEDGDYSFIIIENNWDNIR